MTKVENGSYSNTPIQNQLILEPEEDVELNLEEDDSKTENKTNAINENINNNSVPALMNKTDVQIEGNPKYQTLFPMYGEMVATEQPQNIAPMPPKPNEKQAFNSIQTDENLPEQEIDTSEKTINNMHKKVGKKVKTAKTVKKHHRPQRQPVFDEPFINEPMYPPVYQQPEPPVTEQEIKDSALLSADLPKVQRPQLVPMNKVAKEKMQKMEREKAKNDKLQEQLSSSIQTVRALNERKIEQEKQLARRAYEDSLAVQEMKNQIKNQNNKTEPKKIEKKQAKQVPKAEIKTVPKAKTEPKKAVQPQKKAQPKVKETKLKAQAPKTAETKKENGNP
ncbi:MAG: hypothetical protein KGV51_04465 [Moraxellaceae bacterium]|nr:hypothetical protein [Moraxellaceae bacterium]